MKAIARLLLVAVLVTPLLVACGQKGDLYLPGPEQRQEEEKK